MSLPDFKVRAKTAVAVEAARDTKRDVRDAASRARSALTGLPGMGTGDVVASAMCFVAAPKRMAVYDRHAHHGLTLVGLELNNRRGRYGRYIGLVEQSRLELADNEHEWTARQVDLALYQLGGPSRRTTSG